MMNLNIINNIKQNKYFIFTIAALLSSFFWYLSFVYWQNYFIYGISLIIFGFINSVLLGKILSRHGFEKELQFILGLFLLIFLVAFGMAIPIVLYKVTPIFLFGLLLFLSLIISFLSRYTKSVPQLGGRRRQLPSLISEEDSELNKPIFNIPKVVYALWFGAYAFAFFLLIYSRTGEYIRSPWTVIHPLYLYLWLGIVFFIGLLIFTKVSFKKYLLFIILGSLLIHAYLLIPYEAGFGGDKWRHIGAEKWLIQGNVYTPALFGEEVSYKQIGSFKVPEVFIVGNKTSYSNMWGIVIALSWLTGLEVFLIDLILGILLFSIFLPFLLLKIASFISRKKEFLYLVIFSPFLFYPFQAYGSITIPMSFAFLPFLFSLIFLLKYFSEPATSKKLFLYLAFFIPFLYFNYILYLVLFLEILLLIIVFKNLALASPANKKWFVSLFIFCFILLLLFIPLLDTSNQFSWFKYPFPDKQEVISAFKDFPQRIVFSKAIFPRTYRMEQDNWLYSITEEHFSRSVLLRILPWSIILTPILLFVVIFGFIRYRRLDRPKIGFIFLLMLIMVMINQMTATYFMDGNHIFSKRLVIFSSFLVFIPLSWGIYRLCLSRIFSRKATVISLMLLLALISTTVYASGPKFQVVTADEFESAKYIWKEIQKNKVRSAQQIGSEKGKGVCVLANTWPLLALEGVSARQITTGGFPYYYEYRQPERVQLFRNMNDGPSVRYLEKSLDITGADSCYFMTEKRWIDFNKREAVIEQIDRLLGEHKSIGKVMIWFYKPNEIRSSLETGFKEGEL